MPRIRPPAVAGFFYPATPAQLGHDIGRYLHEGRTAPLRPKALIVPHAGYAYSGPIAASAYRLLVPLHERIHRVVLLGPAHRAWVNGLALPDADFFETPLGRVELDITAMNDLAPSEDGSGSFSAPGAPTSGMQISDVHRNATAHAPEHALEVQLPFLQMLLDHFTLIPLIVGETSPKAVARVLDVLWGGDETLIVVSSDLSHYLPYARACERDADTAQNILALHATLDGDQACGALPINGLLLAARQHALQAHQLDLRNSGDTAGDKTRVVGYGAFAFTEKRP